MTDPVNGCRYCGKDRRAHSQEQHAGRPGFEVWVEPTDEQRKERLRVRAATPADETALTDEEWREFQAIPDQGYSHRGWVDARIKQRLATSPADPGFEVWQRLARAAFQVDSTHHFHKGPDGRPVCACGFVGSARQRTQTEHITAAVLEAFDHD